MHPSHVTAEMIRQYGAPSVHTILGVTLVNFPYGRSGYHYAEKFAQAACLQNPNASEIYHSRPRNEESIRRIQELEGLPAMVNLVPDIEKKLSLASRQARLGEISWDQQFYNTFRFILKCMRDSSTQATAYPLLQGPPGASKTQVAVAISAVTNRPIYPVVGGDGASDEIKAALLGGPYPSDKEPWAIAKESALVGGLREAHSEQYLLSLLHSKTFEAISQEEFERLASLEGIRAGITYDKKGAYQLAAENGGILLLEECNSFPAEVHSILTQILENYLQGQTHPNFFIIATQNPAGDKHPSRNPLPKEVVNRFEVCRVDVPSQEQYAQSLAYMFTREQPTIELATGKKGKVTPLDLGMDMPPSPPGSLVTYLTNDSLRAFVENLTAFHKAVEEKIESGILDPKDVEEPPTRETTFLSRRNLRRLINGIESEIHSTQHAQLSGRLSWEEYLQSHKPTRLNTHQLVSAVWSALQRYYIEPNSFSTHQKVEIETKTKNQTAKVLTNTRDILLSLAKSCHVDIAGLKQTLMTGEEHEQLKKEFSDKFLHAASQLKVPATTLDRCFSAYEKLSDYQHQHTCLLQDREALTIAYPLTEDPFDWLDQICPHLKLQENNSDTVEKLLNKLEKRRKELVKQNLDYLTTDEIKSCRTWVESLRKEKAIYFIPAYHQTEGGTRIFCLIASLHKSLFSHYSAEGHEVEPSSPQERENLEQLRNLYPRTFINVNFILSPRKTKGAITAPPLHSLVTGGLEQPGKPDLVLGKNAPTKSALLELVKIATT